MTAQHFHKELNGIEEKRASKIELNTGWYPLAVGPWPDPSKITLTDHEF